MLDAERFKRWLAAIMTPLMAITSVAVLATAIQADTLTIPNNFVDGTAIVASGTNSNNSAISTWANGNIANDNIKSGAAIALSKLAQTTELFIKQAAGTSNVSSGQTGDTNPRVTLTSDGGIKFGAGGASALDSLLKRSGAAAFLFRNAADSADAAVGCGAVTSSGVVTGTGFTKTGGSQGSALYVGASGVITELAASANQFVGWNSAGTALVAKTAPICSGGRLTLESGVGVSTTDQTAKTTLYFTPYGQDGNVISIYDGTSFIPCTFSQLSTAVPSTTNTMYSVWATQSGGTVSISTNAWTNDTTPGTNGATTTLNGVLVANADNTKRFLGVIRTTSSTGQCEDSKKRRFVANALNQVPRELYATDTTDSWTTTNTSWHTANGSTAVGTARTEFLIPFAGILTDVSYTTSGTFIGGSYGAACGLALDSTSSPTAWGNASAYTVDMPNCGGGCRYIGTPAIGYHYLQNLLQVGASAATFTVYGDNGGSLALTRQHGLLLNSAFRVIDTQTRNKLKGKQNESNVVAFRPRRALRTAC